MNRLVSFAVFVFLTMSIVLSGQNQNLQLAQQFYKKAEYEKALPLYKDLYDSSNGSQSYYRYYFRCLVQLSQFEEAQKLLKKQRKKNKKLVDPSYSVDEGWMYREQERIPDAKALFDQAISELKDNTNLIRSLANNFNQIEEFQYSVQSYLEGKKLLKDDYAFAYELAIAYKRKGELGEMITHYLDLLTVQPGREQTVKNEFARILKYEEHRDRLQTELYQRIQKDDSNLLFVEMLVWLFVQEKDYESALIQVKAIDKRLQENGQRVFNLGQSALIDKQFDDAINAFSYVSTKDATGPFYQQAKIGLVNTKMERLRQNVDHSQEELLELEADYLSLLTEFGKTPTTAVSMRDLSRLYAFYLHDLPKGVEVLKEIIDMPSASARLRGRSKLDLGDFYVMKNDVWEATLLYSQVDKSFKEDLLGEEARFRNAKLSYYNGDFDWSQAQLDILKASTSELIANDALDLSVFIMDNMGLDTTEVPMQLFAQADLLIFQNKIDEAFTKLDELDESYPGHALSDDILFARGRLERQRKDFGKAVGFFETVLADFGTDLLADDALFALAEINENQLENSGKAMELYQSIIIDYPGSLYTVEARKRFRRLRGDRIN